MYHKSISYDVWFLRYEVPQTEFFCHKCTKNLIIGYTVPEIWRVTDVIIFILGYTSPIYSCPLELSSFDTSVPKIMIICYTVPEIWHVTDVIFFHFGQFFALFAPLTVQKIKKKEENTWRYHHFTQVYQKSRSYALLFLRYGA